MKAIIETQNSIYEIDYDNKKIRRVSGVNPPTERFTPNGKWKNYYAILPQGPRLLIFWPDSDGSNATLTSPVIEGHA